MKWLLLIATFFSFELGYAQEEEIYSIFFEFDKFSLKEEQAEGVLAFVQKLIRPVSNPSKFMAIATTEAKTNTTLCCLPTEPQL